MTYESHRGTPQEVKEALDRLLREGIKPHAEQIAAIGLAGWIAVVVYDLAPDPETQAFARAMGWDGRTPVFRMSAAVRRRLARSDTVTAAWLSRKPDPDPSRTIARIFVRTGLANFLVNFGPQRGYYFEPGSLDSERV